MEEAREPADRQVGCRAGDACRIRFGDNFQPEALAAKRGAVELLLSGESTGTSQAAAITIAGRRPGRSRQNASQAIDIAAIPTQTT